MNNKWKIVPKKTIYSSKFFKIVEQEITFPNQKKKIHDVVERKSTVTIFPVTPSYDLYLISQYRTLFGKYVIEAISGHIDKNELPLNAAKRELKEEAGLIGHEWKEIGRIENSGSVIKSMMHLFLVRDLEEGKASPDETEDITLLKISLDEAVKKVMLGEINISSSVIGILFLDKMRRERKL